MITQLILKKSPEISARTLPMGILFGGEGAKIKGHVTSIKSSFETTVDNLLNFFVTGTVVHTLHFLI